MSERQYRLTFHVLVECDETLVEDIGRGIIDDIHGEGEVRAVEPVKPVRLPLSEYGTRVNYHPDDPSWTDAVAA